MTLTHASPLARERVASVRTVLMCRPEFFTVRYRINPWMHPDQPTDTALAIRQWDMLHHTYLRLGFHVELIDPIPGLPDMVFAANGAFVLDNIAYGSSFAYPQRQPEAPAYLDWLEAQGFEVRAPDSVNEGEGDFLLAGDIILAGTGFRSAPESHAEVARVFGREVISLRLVDANFYHLDTALAVLDNSTIAYLPSAFDRISQRKLELLFPDALIVSQADADVLGLNAFSDGLHVVIAEQAEDFAEQLREAGFSPVGVDLSELRRGGGGVKCCTLELRR